MASAPRALLARLLPWLLLVSGASSVPQPSAFNGLLKEQVSGGLGDSESRRQAATNLSQAAFTDVSFGGRGACGGRHHHPPLTLLSPLTSRLYPNFPNSCGLAPGSPEYLNLFRAEARSYNDLVLYFLPNSLRSSLGLFLETWLRNYVGGLFVYFVGSGLWAAFVYLLFGSYFFPNEEDIPTAEAIGKQIAVSLKAMPLYSLLPTVSEWLVESGWTRCYSGLSEVSVPAYVVQVFLYLSFVEFAIYWLHRGLHDIKFLYRWLHATHHIYNKQSTLSPFAGLAFNPFDGITQASPHVVALFFLPTHFTTHMLLFFLEGVWTTNIHDCIHANVFPIMGAGYHTIHHTTYKHNYGHYTVLMDWLFGTLHTPEEYRSKKKAA